MSGSKRAFSETFPSTNQHEPDDIIYREVDAGDFSSRFIWDLHEKIRCTTIYQITVRDPKTNENFTGIERKNIIVPAAIACKNILKLLPNERVRFSSKTDIVHYLEKKKIIKLIYQSPSKRGDDIFIITSLPQKELDRPHQFAASPLPGQALQGSAEDGNLYRFHIDKIAKLEKECANLSFSLKRAKEDADLFYDAGSTKTKTIKELTSQLESMKKEKDEKISDLNTVIYHITEEKQSMFQYFNTALMQRGTEICRLQGCVTEMLKKEEQNTLLNSANTDLNLSVPSSIDPRIVSKLERTNVALLSTVNQLTTQLDQQDKLYSSTSRQLADLQAKSISFISLANEKEQENQVLMAKIVQLEEENTNLQKESRAIQISPTNITLELEKRNALDSGRTYPCVEPIDGAPKHHET